MKPYDSRGAYEKLARLLNDLGAQIAGEDSIELDDGAPYWIEESYRINNDNTSTTVWKVKPEVPRTPEAGDFSSVYDLLKDDTSFTDEETECS